MKTLAEYINEGFGAVRQPKKLPNAPMQFEDFKKSAEFIAKKLKCETSSYPKDDRYWVAVQREEFLKTVWNACLREIKPQGFDAKLAGITISSDLSSFYANETRVDERCPAKWRAAVEDWLVSAIHSNEKKWLDSRFEIIAKNGRESVKSFW